MPETTRRLFWAEFVDGPRSVKIGAMAPGTPQEEPILVGCCECRRKDEIAGFLTDQPRGGDPILFQRPGDHGCLDYFAAYFCRPCFDRWQHMREAAQIRREIDGPTFDHDPARFGGYRGAAEPEVMND